MQFLKTGFCVTWGDADLFQSAGGRSRQYEKADDLKIHHTHVLVPGRICDRQSVHSVHHGRYSIKRGQCRQELTITHQGFSIIAPQDTRPLLNQLPPINYSSRHNGIYSQARTRSICLYWHCFLSSNRNGRKTRYLDTRNPQ